MPPSTEYKGLPIRKYSAAVRGASGDALDSALKVAPQDFNPGVKAYMVLEVDPNGEQFKPMDDGEAWEEVQIVRVARGAFVSAKVALPHLDAVSVAIEVQRVKDTGQERLDIETKMTDDHLAGLHKRARKACELCQTADPLGVGEAKPVGAYVDEVVARAEAFAAKNAHGDGEGDPDNPLPPARRHRTKKGAAAKKAPAKKAPAKKQTSTRR